jgi:hypothetical protein
MAGTREFAFCKLGAVAQAFPVTDYKQWGVSLQPVTGRDY